MALWTAQPKLKLAAIILGSNIKCYSCAAGTLIHHEKMTPYLPFCSNIGQIISHGKTLVYGRLERKIKDKNEYLYSASFHNVKQTFSSWSWKASLNSTFGTNLALLTSIALSEVDRDQYNTLIHESQSSTLQIQTRAFIYTYTCG